MRKLVRIQPMKFQGHRGILLQTPFDKDFVRELKAMVPYTDRWFNEHKSGWFVSQAFADVATHLAHQRFGGAEIIDDEGDRVVITAAGERCHQEKLF